MFVSRVILAVLLLVCVAAPVAAQSADVSGTVTDAQGAVVRDAEVQLIAQSSQFLRTTRSTSDGTFVFTGVAQGRYSLQVTAPGFTRSMRELVVGAGPLTLAIRLEVAGVAEEVVVAGEVPSTLSAPSSVGSRIGLTPLDTPASIQIVTGQAIAERGDVSVTDAVIRTAGMTTAPSASGGMGGVSYRGFTGSDSIIQLYDGLQLWVAQGTVTFPFDAAMADRIEVLGGPSSVLYGTGGIGGAVNTVPLKPNPDRFTHDVRLSVGSHNTVRGKFGSGGPLSSRVSYRFDVSGLNTDGWVDRGNSDSTAIAGAVRFDVAPTWHLTLSHDYGLQRPAYDTGVPFINGRLDESQARRNYNVSDAKVTIRDRWTQIRSEWTPTPSVTVRSNLYGLTAYRHWYGLLGYVHDPVRNLIRRTTGSDVFHNQRQYGLHSDALIRGAVFGRENVLSIGFDYGHGTFRWINNMPYTWVSFVDLDNSEPGIMINLDPVTPKFRTVSDRYTTYLEDRLAISTRLSLVGGLRVEHSVLDRLEIQTNSPSGHSFTPVTGRGGLVYKIANDFAVYGQMSTATDSIGALLTLTPQQQRLKLTTGRQVEFGVKQSLPANRGDWTFAVFRIVKENLVTQDREDPTVSIQIGQQSSQGFEASGRALLGHGLQVEANGTWLRARYDDFIELVGGRPISRVGNRPANVPRAAGNLWLAWNATSRWQARGGVRIVGERFGNTDNTFVVPQYSVVDGGLRVALTNRTGLDLRIYNALDKIYVVAPRGNLNNPQWLLGRPLGFDVSWTASF